MTPSSLKLHPEAAGPLPDLGVVLCAGCWSGSRARCRDLRSLTKMLVGTEPLAGVTLPGPLLRALVLTVTLPGSSACAVLPLQMSSGRWGRPDPSPPEPGPVGHGLPPRSFLVFTLGTKKRSSLRAEQSYFVSLLGSHFAES